MLMLRVITRGMFRFSKFKLEEYSKEDFATMCGLLRQKFLLHNEQVQTSGLVKLIDDSGRVIGMYTASEARKKAYGMDLDMVLVNKSASPIICKAVDFRKRLLNRFYEEVVIKAQSKQQSRATSTKNIKVSPNLGKNDMIVKVKQITQLSNKHAKVRVFMNIKQTQRDEGLSKLQQLKSLLMNNCYIEEEVSNRRFEEEEESGKSESQVQTFSFVIKAREFDVVKKPQEQKKDDADSAVKRFMAKYYTQDDGEMMDLRSAGFFQTETGIVVEEEKKITKVEERGFREEEKKNEFEESIQREAQARVLNKRLKVLLAFTI